MGTIRYSNFQMCLCLILLCENYRLTMEKFDFDDLLKTEVEQIFGQKISDKHACELLSTRIQKEIGENIGYQTLRRYWQLMTLKNAISIQSKNILCRYVGFKDFEKFSNYIKTKSNKETATNWNIIKDWYSINDQDEPLANNHYWHNKLSQAFAQFILTDKAVFESFCKAMHTNEVAMKYIISYHPMYDNIAEDWYFRGLHLFVRNAKELHYKLFEVTLLFMKAVMTKSESNIENLIKNIENLLPKIRKKHGVIWALEARVYSCLLYFYKSQNDEKKFNELKNECFQLLIKNSNSVFETDNKDVFIFILSDYCNIYQMQEISDILLSDYSLYFSENALWKNGYNNASIIVKTMSLFLNYHISEAKKLFKTIHLQNLNFDFKTYFTIQYQLLSLGFCTKNATSKKQKIKNSILQLTQETGLLYFESMIPIFEKLNQA